MNLLYSVGSLNTFLVLFLVTIRMTYSDYNCVCNYNVEVTVYEKADTNSIPIGYIYEFDCKEQIQVNNGHGQWLVIAFSHQLGYVLDSSGIQVQVCQGDAPPLDKVTSTSLTETNSTTEVPISKLSSPPLTTTKHPSSIMRTSVVTMTSPSIPYIHSERTIGLAITPNTITSSVVTSTVLLTETSTTSLPTSKPSSLSTVIKSSSISPVLATLTFPVVFPHASKSTTTRKQPMLLTTTPAISSGTTSISQTALTAVYQTTTNSPKCTSSREQSFQTLDAHLLNGNPALCLPFNLQSTNKVTQFLNYCYEFVLHQPRMWELAKLHCQMHGGNLLTLDTVLEEEYIYQLLARTNSCSVWLGLSSDNHGDLHFTDGQIATGLNTINWQTDMDATNRECVTYQTIVHPGMLVGKDCYMDYDFICKYKIPDHTQSYVHAPIILG